MSVERPVLRPGRLIRPGGRAGRREFWTILAAFALAGVLAVLIDRWMIPGGYPFSAGLAFLALLALPASVTRRLHDRGWRGSWLCLPLLGPMLWLGLSARIAMSAQPAARATEELIGPVVSVLLALLFLLSLVSALWMLVELARPGRPGPNRFGPGPGTGPNPFYQPPRPQGGTSGPGRDALTRRDEDERPPRA